MNRLKDWYNARISARWYTSTALVGGWLTSAVLFLPDLLDMLAGNWQVFGDFLLPSFSVETKAIVLAIYVNFIAPPLRAFVQRKMQQAQIKQLAEQEKVVPLVASGVNTTVVLTSADGKNESSRL
jgi:hypothetical protein